MEWVSGFVFVKLAADHEAYFSRTHTNENKRTMCISLSVITALVKMNGSFLFLFSFF